MASVPSFSVHSECPKKVTKKVTWATLQVESSFKLQLLCHFSLSFLQPLWSLYLNQAILLFSRKCN